MDIGTNSIHILVVRFVQGSMGTIVFQDRESIRLGRDLYRYGRIGHDAIEKARLVTDRFTQAAKNMGADKVIAYATCATREAINRTELLDALDSDGLDVRMIPGPEEARLIRLGVLGTSAPERTLVLDIGGGSTEIALAENDNNLYLDSLAIGAVRFSYDSQIDPTRPMTDGEYNLLRRRIGLSSYRAARMVGTLGYTKAVGSSGTMESLAALCAAKRDGDASYMTLSELRDVVTELRATDIDQRIALPGLNQSRADIIVTGAVAAEGLMSVFGIERIEISQNGLKEGMQIEYLMGTAGEDTDIRGSSVLSLASRCSYDVQHADEVRDKSLLLFDMMGSEGIHRISSDYRKLLEFAATLHDVGEFISYSKHNVHSYTIISNSNMLGFDDQELEAMALMARFHHRKFPDLRSKFLRSMKRKDAENTLKCAMILRMADILDRHRTRSVENMTMRSVKGKAMLELISNDDVRMEIWGLESIADDFRKVFGMELKISFKKNDNHQ